MTINKWFKKLIKRNPKIGILGLNPHNAELIKGSEEKKVSTTIEEDTAEKKKVKISKAPKIQLIKGDARTQMAWLGEKINTNDVCRSQIEEHSPR